MKEEVAKILLKVGAVSLSPTEPYRFVSGILSPIYCDNRLLMSYPEEREKIVNYFLKLIKEENINFEVIAGTATAGIPWAAWIAEKLKKPMVYVRKEAKEHGKQNIIEGKLKAGAKVIVIEDLISTGKSSFNAVKTVRDLQCIVEYCIAIFSYEMEKSKKLFQDGNCKLLTLTNFTTLVDVAVKEGYINDEEKELVLKWNKDPEAWTKEWEN